MTDTKALTVADLMQFTGSEHWYRHALVRDVLYTDGVQYVAETGGAYWLIDEIAYAQRFDKLLAAEEFQSWKLMVNADHTATLTCEDGNGGVVFTKAIEYTDFSLEEINLYFMNKTILLPQKLPAVSIRSPSGAWRRHRARRAPASPRGFPFFLPSVSNDPRAFCADISGRWRTRPGRAGRSSAFRLHARRVGSVQPRE